MDTGTMAATIAVIKGMEDGSVARAEKAAEEAEASAKLAQEYGYKLTLDDGVLVVGEEESE